MGDKLRKGRHVQLNSPHVKDDAPPRWGTEKAGARSRMATHDYNCQMNLKHIPIQAGKTHDQSAGSGAWSKFSISQMTLGDSETLLKTISPKNMQCARPRDPAGLDKSSANCGYVRFSRW